MEKKEDNRAYLEATGKLSTKEWIKVALAFSVVFGTIATLLTYAIFGC